MSESKSHHTVPCSYLKFFSYDGMKVKNFRKSHVYVIDKQLNYSRISTINEVSIVNHYNRVETMDDKTYYEKWYGQWEGRYSSFVEQMVSIITNNEPFTDAFKQDLSILYDIAVCTVTRITENA